MVLQRFTRSLKWVIFPTIGLGHYFALLGALAILFLIAPLFADVQILSVRVSDLLSMSLLIVGVWAVNHSRLAVFVLGALALCAISAQITNFYTKTDLAGVVANSAAGLFLIVLFVVIVVDLFRTSAVTGSTLAAACCGYVLIAGIFAAVFSIMIAFDPDAISLWEGSDVDVSDLVFQEGRFGVLGYYSMVTLTTLGYGDIVPNSDYARAAAALEAVIGQLYLAVIVARLVGMYIAGRASKGKVKALKFD